MAFAARRIDWVSGTVYDKYDDAYLQLTPQILVLVNCQPLIFMF